jgi:hypothetical protein
MVTARTKAVPKIQFPQDSCGACRFCRVGLRKGSYLCWGNPPVAVMHEGEVVWERESPVEAEEPACHHFRPRENG